MDPLYSIPAMERDSGPTEYQSKDQIVIALDFGTTFSGIAYALKKDEKPVAICVLDWPGASADSPNTIEH